jgi:hypothetical protein
VGAIDDLVEAAGVYARDVALARSRTEAIKADALRAATELRGRLGNSQHPSLLWALRGVELAVHKMDQAIATFTALIADLHDLTAEVQGGAGSGSAPALGLARRIQGSQNDPRRYGATTQRGYHQQHRRPVRLAGPSTRQATVRRQLR